MSWQIDRPSLCFAKNLIGRRCHALTLAGFHEREPLPRAQIAQFLPTSAEAIPTNR